MLKFWIVQVKIKIYVQNVVLVIVHLIMELAVVKMERIYKKEKNITEIKELQIENKIGKRL